MKNKEKYKQEILNCDNTFCRFVNEKVLKHYNLECGKVACEQCAAVVAIWLDEEYQEPEPDWEHMRGKKVQVSGNKNEWYDRILCAYLPCSDHPFVTYEGLGSVEKCYTKDRATYVAKWEYCRLPEEE